MSAPVLAFKRSVSDTTREGVSKRRRRLQRQWDRNFELLENYRSLSAPLQRMCKQMVGTCLVNAALKGHAPAIERLDHMGSTQLERLIGKGYRLPAGIPRNIGKPVITIGGDCEGA